MRIPRPTTVRLGIRLARRQLWRGKGRSVLVVLLVFVPALVMTALVTYLRTSEYTRAEWAAATHGRADAYARPADGSVRAEGVRGLRRGLPPGSAVLAERTMPDRVRDGASRAYFIVSDLQLDHRMVEGRFGTLRGREPAGSGEVVVSEDVARDLGIGVGDTLEPDRLGRRLRVVGVIRVRVPQYVEGQGISSENEGRVFVAGELPDAPFVVSTVWVDVPDAIRSPVGSDDQRWFQALDPISGWEVYPNNDTIESDQTSGVFWAYLGGAVGLIVLATIITAAFAVGARRQLSTIGLLSSTGASPRTVKWFLVTQGAVLGALGSIAGVVTGALLVRLTPQRLLDSMNELHVDGVVTRPLDVVPIVLLGTLVAAGAAWLPPRSASKVASLQALAGRRPLGRVPRRLPILGAVSILVGCGLFGATIATLTSGGASGLMLFPIAGSMAVLFGAIADRAVGDRADRTRQCAVDGGVAARRPQPRSQPSGSSAVVGAVCAVTIAVVAGTTIYASLGPDSDECCEIELPNLRPNQVVVGLTALAAPVQIPDDVLTRVLAVTPGARMVPLVEPALEGAPEIGPLKGDSVFASYVGGDGRGIGARVGIATPALLDALDVPSRLLPALRRGEAVSVIQPPFTVEEVRVSFQGGSRSLPLGGAFASPAASSFLPQILIAPEAAASLGLVERSSSLVLLELARPMSERQRDALELLQNDIRWEMTPQGPWFMIDVASDNFEVSSGFVKAIIMAIAMLLILGVVAVGLALAARDSEDEAQVLSAVGAPPRTLRRVGALRGMFLTLTAALIAVPAALLASAVIVAASDTIRVFRVDWWAVVFVVAVVPLVVGAVALAGARLRDAIRRPRPDVFAFSE